MITTTTGETATGHLPSWAEVDPSEQEVPPEELAVRLADINHSLKLPGQVLRAYSPANPTGRPTPVEVLHGSIDCTPYATAPELTTPVVNLLLAGEHWLTDLGPTDLTQLAGGLRALAARLEDDVVPALIEARTEWTTYHPHTAGVRQ
ncbi:hypothetical protein OG896_20425 [Streptomyces sp. NBC_00669]|uniref:DUF6907 domain-containing protein n=1 Tax=unclassified Streptomyces TaxID=2593676 RepID=UPI002E235BAF|nr:MULTISPECIES: hypothetical protein [unclassified Streptomyces]